MLPSAAVFWLFIQAFFRKEEQEWQNFLPSDPTSVMHRRPGLCAGPWRTEASAKVAPEPGKERGRGADIFVSRSIQRDQKPLDRIQAGEG